MAAAILELVWSGKERPTRITVPGTALRSCPKPRPGWRLDGPARSTRGRTPPPAAPAPSPQPLRRAATRAYQVGRIVSRNWRDEAACLHEDPELFFPIGTTGRALEQIEEAKAVCKHCPVIKKCLEWALDTNQDAGVWGGLSDEERRLLRRRRQRRRLAEPVRAGPEIAYIPRYTNAPRT